MQLKTVEPTTSAPKSAADRVLVINENSVERDEAVQALQADGIDAVGAACASGDIDGRFDVVVVSASPAETLVDLVRNVRERQLARSVAAPEGRLFGPGGLQLWPRAREASRGGKRVSLSPKESDVLRVLLEHQNDVLSSDDIATAVWGHETYGSPNFVEAQISRLRSKLAVIGAGEAIQTVWREGYKISESSRL
jgi:DNA-binding response OmpR family regulator